MGKIEGERSVEIDAPIEKVFAIAADIDNAAEWQGSLKEVDVLERDGDGRAELVDTKSDAMVKTVSSRLRFRYEEPGAVRWTQEKGDTKSLEGWWTLEEVSTKKTRATYGLSADPGRVLGMLLRGPVAGKVRDFLLGDAADGLKRQAESAKK